MSLIQHETKSNLPVESHQTKTIQTNRKELLEILFSRMPSNQKLLIWTKISEKINRSDWFDNWQDAQQFAESKKDSSDVYFGLSTVNSTEKKTHKERIKNEEVCGISALFADVDFLDAKAHAGKNYPPTENDALALIKAFSLPPSAIISSGFGFHCYWILTDWCEIDSVEKRTQIRNLSKEWQQLLRDKAKQIGNWTIDFTHDLARILRVTNTKNFKDSNDSNEPKEVKIVKINKHTYSLEDFENLVGNVEVKSKKVIPNSDSNYNYVGELREDAEKPERKFNLLSDANGIFKLSYEKNRPDMQDQSGSGYEFSFANFTTKARWNFQEYLDLCVDFRRRHKLTPKSEKNGNALEYYRNTWHNAQVEFLASQKTQDQKRVEGLDLLREFLNLENFVSVGLRGENYEFHFTDKIIVLGSDILQQGKVRKPLMKHRIKFPKTFNSIEWKRIMDAITDSFIEIETHTESQELKSFVVDYVRTQLKHLKCDTDEYKGENANDIKNTVENIRKKGVFDTKENTVFLPLTFFTEFLSKSRYTKSRTQIEVAAWLELNDFSKKQKSIRFTDKKEDTSMRKNVGRFYVSPKNYFEGEEELLNRYEE